jgi:enterobactin synthetase component D
MESLPISDHLPRFATAFWLALPHGLASVVRIPEEPGAIPEDVLCRLFPEEAAYARGLSEHRQARWVGGRLAVHDAIRRLKGRLRPVLTGEGGEPVAPPEIAVSVTHKRDYAVGLVAFARGCTLGVDLEDFAPNRAHLADRILAEPEMVAMRHLHPQRQGLFVLLHFSIKEAVYKAIYPWLHRSVGFHEVILRVFGDGSAAVSLLIGEESSPREGQGGSDDPLVGQAPPEQLPLRVDARYHWLPDRVLCSARATRAPGGPGFGSTLPAERPLTTDHASWSEEIPLEGGVPPDAILGEE